MVTDVHRAWLATWAVPVVAVAIAVTQVIVASTGTLSPWKGGGFGMFSTLDDPPSRTLRAQVTTDTGVVHLDVRELRNVTRGGQRAYLGARAFPDERRTQRLVDEICAHRWEVAGGPAQPVARSSDPGPQPCRDGLHVTGPDGDIRARHVDLRVIATEPDRDVLTPRPLRTVDVELGGAP